MIVWHSLNFTLIMFFGVYVDGNNVDGNNESRVCRVGWRKRAWELRGCLKANPPAVCDDVVLVGRLSRGNGWYGFCDANPPYESWAMVRWNMYKMCLRSKLCRVCWRKGAEELRGCLKANSPVECEGFVLAGWLSRGNGWYGFCDANLRSYTT